MIFNYNNTEWKTGEGSLILGQRPALLDSINRKHKRLFELYKGQKSVDWSEDEIDLDSSRLDFTRCPQEVYDGMISNLAFQWEADSIAANAMSVVLAPFITDSDFKLSVTKNSEMECLTPDHEVLTPQGWKPIDQITIEDEVLQVDISSLEGSFIKPSRVISKDHDGIMYHFYNEQNHVSQIVTPNHRMPTVSRNTGKSYFRVAEDAVYNSSSMIPVSSLVKGGFDSLSDYHRFLIACQADGCVDTRCDGSVSGTIPVSFGMSKERKVSRLNQIVKNLGWKMVENKTQKRGGNVKDLRKFRVSVPIELAHNLKDFGWVDLRKVGEKWAEEFLDEVVMWDGVRTGKEANFITTTDRTVAETIQAVASMGGYSTNFRVRKDNRKESYKDCYTCSWKKLPYRGKAIIKDKISYKGKVYCLSVPTSAFLIRHNNAVSVTGNCTHALTYSEIVRLAIPEPQDVFKKIMENDKITERMSTLNGVLLSAQKKGALYTIGQLKNDQDLYNTAFMALVAFYCLERLQFMSSFAHTFAIVELGYFQGVGKLVQKIMQDERIYHCRTMEYALKVEMDTKRGMLAYMEKRNIIVDLVNEVLQREYDWNKHIFSTCSILGMNEELMNSWVEWNAQEVYKLLMIDTPFTKHTKNPLSFMDDWLNIDAFQHANQEGDNNNYSLNSFVDDVDESIVFNYY